MRLRHRPAGLWRPGEQPSAQTLAAYYDTED